MIFDRTKSDVDMAIKIREEKVKNFIPLTNEERNILERGMVTNSTLNRIEAQHRQLKTKLNSMGYWNTPILTETWDTSKIFRERDFMMMVKDTMILRNAFLAFEDTPKSVNLSYSYQNLNNLERILHDLGLMVNIVTRNYLQCGDAYCGGN